MHASHAPSPYEIGAITQKIVAEAESACCVVTEVRRKGEGAAVPLMRPLRRLHEAPSWRFVRIGASRGFVRTSTDLRSELPYILRPEA